MVNRFSHHHLAVLMLIGLKTKLDSTMVFDVVPCLHFISNNKFLFFSNQNTLDDLTIIIPKFFYFYSFFFHQTRDENGKRNVILINQSSREGRVWTTLDSISRRLNSLGACIYILGLTSSIKMKEE